MAIFIDRRPKLDKQAIILSSISFIIFILCCKGCTSDRIDNNTREISTEIVVKGKHTSIIDGDTNYYIDYTVGENSGKIKVTKDTYYRAVPGHTMWFSIKKIDYDDVACFGYVTLTLFTCITLVFFIIAFFFNAIPSIFRRYF